MNKPWEITPRDWVPHKNMDFQDPLSKRAQGRDFEKGGMYRQPGYFSNRKVIPVNNPTVRPDRATVDKSTTPSPVKSRLSSHHRHQTVKQVSLQKPTRMSKRLKSQHLCGQEHVDSHERINKWLGGLPAATNPIQEPVIQDKEAHTLSRVRRISLPRHDAVRKAAPLQTNHHIFKLKNKMLANKPADMLKNNQITDTRLNNVTWHASRQRPLLAPVKRIIV